MAVSIRQRKLHINLNVLQYGDSTRKIRIRDSRISVWAKSLPDKLKSKIKRADATYLPQSPVKIQCNVKNSR